MSKHYYIKGKTYIIPELNMKREADKKLAKYLNKLDDNRKFAFETVAKSISEQLIWNQLNKHIERSLINGSPLMVRGNIYDLKEDINSVFKRIDRWVRHNEKFSPEKIKDFSASMLKTSKSICRVLDQNATCWRHSS